MSTHCPRPAGRRLGVPQRILDDLRLTHSPAELHRFYHGLVTLRTTYATAPADPARLRTWLYLPNEIISDAHIEAQLDALQTLGIIQRYDHHGEPRCHLLALRISTPRNPQKIPSPRAGDAQIQPDQSRDSLPATPAPPRPNFPVIIPQPAQSNPNFTPAPTLSPQRRQELEHLVRVSFHPDIAVIYIFVLKLFYLLSQPKADWPTHASKLTLGPSHDPAAAHQALLTRNPAAFLNAHLSPNDPNIDYATRLAHVLSQTLTTHLEAQCMYTYAKNHKP